MIVVRVVVAYVDVCYYYIARERTTMLVVDS